MSDAAPKGDTLLPVLESNGASAAAHWVMAFNIFDELKERGKGGKR